MIFRYLFRIVMLTFFCFITSLTIGQQVHFIYLQTDNAQPFYVKLNNNVTSSSSLGYLIIPKLSDGNYDVTIGFPKKEFPEEKFQLLVDKKSEGFLLKNFGDRGWGLFNLQSFSVTMGSGQLDSMTVATNVQSDPFSKMLATVVKDSSILERPAEVVKSTPVKTDTVVALHSEMDTSMMVYQTKQSALLSTINRTLFNKNKDGVEMIYLDKLENTADTIRIFIPASASVGNGDSLSNNVGIAEKKPDMVDQVNLKSPDSSISGSGNHLFSNDQPDTLKDLTNLHQNHATSMQDSAKLQKVTNDKDMVAPVDVVAPVDANENKANKVIKVENSQGNGFPKVVEYSKINSDCKSFASNEDFIKLRKKIAGENNDDNMLKEAKKGFRSVCFSTEQIKNLSFLFLTDEGKYRFFDTAYAFTSDSDQYYKLQGQLSDPYFINRFKAMIHK